MRIPPSPHFTPVALDAAYNADRARLDGGFQPRTDGVPDWSIRDAFDEQAYHGIPFRLGQPDRANVILLTPGEEVRLEVPPSRASYLVVLHAVEDRAAEELPGFGEIGPTPMSGRDVGNALGTRVADYALVYEDGSEAVTPILRRFAIQQRHISWGASPFAAVPALGPCVFTTSSEDFLLNRVAADSRGRTETRHDSMRMVDSENLWLYALPNPQPDAAIRALRLRGGEERVVVYAISATNLESHPLRPGVRRKLRLTLPEGMAPNALGEIDADSRDPAIGIDLGTVISARAAS